MTRAAMQKALDALDGSSPNDDHITSWNEHHAAMTAMRAALAEPEAVDTNSASYAAGYKSGLKQLVTVTGLGRAKCLIRGDTLTVTYGEIEVAKLDVLPSGVLDGAMSSSAIVAATALAAVIS